MVVKSFLRTEAAPQSQTTSKFQMDFSHPFGLARKWLGVVASHQWSLTLHDHVPVVKDTAKKQWTERKKE
ncbi:hypothetical protein M0802_001415 [Mischocyttarus mexicanus]|nr:hypothetical protein M0802_001415 [Mischocyttarus mexicanus]